MRLALDPSDPADGLDQHVVLQAVSWADYQSLLAIRGDERPGVRLYYLEGDLELISPSRTHEWIKTTVGRLLEAYADEAGIELTGYGSLTMRSARRERGAEPDECYVIGAARPKTAHPDLAIEVEWTPGGLDKLEIYRGLGIRELWICRPSKETAKVAIEVLALRRGQYVTVAKSRLLPRLELALFTECLESESQTRAVKILRTSLRAGR
ncbi:MAG TPA: Uma2 family endonuclease [Polyangia bacterium]|nr:Uma2 family endonuclease [Polyangia bacterium]